MHARQAHSQDGGRGGGYGYGVATRAAGGKIVEEGL